MVMLSGFGASSWLFACLLGGLAISCVYGPGLRRPQILRGVWWGIWECGGGGPQSPSPPEDRLSGAHVPLPKNKK